MEVTFFLQYHELVIQEDIPCLPKIWREAIRKAIEEKLTTHPEVYGKPLRRSLKGYHKLRVGDYRVVFRIEEQTVRIFIIQHRSIVYGNAEKRF